MVAAVGGYASLSAATLFSLTEQSVYSTQQGEVKTLSLREGARISAGTAVMTIKIDAVTNAVNNAQLSVKEIQTNIRQLQEKLADYTLTSPIDGIVIVASPQELVSMIVQKAVKMAKMMNVPILGLVENMSWFMCPDCGKKHSIFGDSRIEEVAKEYDTQVLAKLPIDPELAKCVDEGKIELFSGDYLDDAAEIIEKELSK